MFLTSRGNVSTHSVKCVKGCFQSSSEIWAVKVWVGARFSMFLAFWMQTYHSSKISLSVLFKCTLCVLQQHVCKLTPKLFFKLFLHNCMLSKADVYYYLLCLFLSVSEFILLGSLLVCCNVIVALFQNQHQILEVSWTQHLLCGRWETSFLPALPGFIWSKIHLYIKNNSIYLNWNSFCNTINFFTVTFDQITFDDFNDFTVTWSTY